MTKQPTISDIQKLLLELLVPFTEIKRDMPLPTPDYRNENDAEHSWSLAVLATSLAERIDPGLDTGKVCMFAVVHDLVELYAGDTSFWGEPDHKASKHQREADSLKKIAQEFGAFPWIARTIKDYESKNSPEAKFVYATDKFINYLIRTTDKGRYFKENKITKTVFDSATTSHRKKAYAYPEIGKYYDQMLKLFKPTFFA